MHQKPPSKHTESRINKGLEDDKNMYAALLYTVYFALS